MTLTDYKGRAYDVTPGHALVPESEGKFIAECERCHKTFLLAAPERAVTCINDISRDQQRHFAREIQRVAARHHCRRARS